MVAQLDDPYKSRLGAARIARRVASWAMFEGRPHTTKGQWFNPVVFGLLRTMSAVPGKPTLDRPIFVTGLGRSGTTILGKLFSAHPDVGFLNEPKAIWSLIAPDSDVCADYVESGGRFRLSANDASTEKSQLAHRLFSRYLSMVGAKRLVDKYPELVFRLDFVRALLPDAKLVFITRHGRDACQSIALWSTRKGRNSDSQDEQTEDWWGRDGVKWRYLMDELVKPDSRYADIAGLDESKFSEVERAAVEWLVTTEAGLDWEQGNPGQIIRVVYEDLANDPQTVIPAMLTACELSIDQDLLDYASEVLNPPPLREDPELCDQIKQQFNRVLVRAGYE